MTRADTDDAHRLQLLAPSSLSLNQVAKTIRPGAIKADAIQLLIHAMLDLARGEQGNPDQPTMVGLAAPQIGVSKRIIIVGIDADGTGNSPEFRAYINPEIIDYSKQTNLNREGCYSTGHVCGVVARSNRIKLKALDYFGNPVLETHESFVARIIQHEVDHLNGIRFPDRIIDDRLLFWVEPEQFGDFREHWQTWPHNCSRAAWLAIKSGTQIA